MRYLVIVPLLVGVLRPASPDLHLCAIGVYTVGDIQAFVVEDLDHAAGESPLLGGATSAWLDGHPSAVVVRSGGETFA